jgi:thiol-disulfide isomerase/thioredoxin
MIIDRLLVSGALVMGGVAFFLVGRAIHLGRLRQRLAHANGVDTPGLASFQPGRPALLYFFTEHCAPCRTVLKPALQRLGQELGSRLQLLEINAESQAEATQYWKVLSVPTIFVLDPQGQPRHVHYGVVSAEVLRNELGDWLDPRRPI